jgi:flagellum-specific peptidoglycan hydrolase FlgJ
MNNTNFNLAGLIWDNVFKRAFKILSNQWVQVTALGCLLYLAATDKVSFNFKAINTQSANVFQNGVLYGTPFGFNQNENKKTGTKAVTKLEEKNSSNSNPLSKLNLANEATAVGEALSAEEQKIAARLSNLSVVFNSAEYFEKNNISKSVVAAKQKTCEVYIKHFSKTAQEEANTYNIPASITLAQGLLESNAGDSKLAKKENNHFGIKCRAKCQGCRCANYTDDDRFDMFRIFDSAWQSYREHSKLLSSGRYKYLTKLERSDYKNWARGLKSAGYATDKKYAEKLIAIIEHFDLDRFDR